MPYAQTEPAPGAARALSVTEPTTTPSDAIIWPVTQSTSSLMSQATSRAVSSGRPHRPAGTAAATRSRSACVAYKRLGQEQRGASVDREALVDFPPWARYSYGMTTKIAVSLPDELVVGARKAVAEGRAPSVSAFIAGALEEQSRYGGLADLLAEMAAEAGPPTERDRDWARRALGLD